MTARVFLILMIIGLIALGPVGWAGIIGGSVIYLVHEKVKACRK